LAKFRWTNEISLDADVLGLANALNLRGIWLNETGKYFLTFFATPQ
jgi:hypothetical protein